jgi:hypothetical protein
MGEKYKEMRLKEGFGLPLFASEALKPIKSVTTTSWMINFVYCVLSVDVTLGVIHCML